MEAEVIVSVNYRTCMHACIRLNRAEKSTRYERTPLMRIVRSVERAGMDLYSFSRFRLKWPFLFNYEGISTYVKVKFEAKAMERKRAL